MNADLQKTLGSFSNLPNLQFIVSKEEMENLCNEVELFRSKYDKLRPPIKAREFQLKIIKKRKMTTTLLTAITALEYVKIIESTIKMSKYVELEVALDALKKRIS